MKNSTWDFIKTLTMVYVILTSFFSTSSSVYANAATQSEIFFNLKPSRESRNNCFVLLEPIREDEVESRIIEVVCGLTNVELETKYRTSSSYVVLQFYDDTNYNNLIVNFAGPQRCSATVSYSVSSMPTSVNNRAGSGSSYSGCYNIMVFDLSNFAGDSYSCQDNCPSFGALNDRVSSWRISN